MEGVLRLSAFIAICIFVLITVFRPYWGLYFLTVLLFYHARLFEMSGASTLVAHLPLFLGIFTFASIALRPIPGTYNSALIVASLGLLSLWLCISTLSSQDVPISTWVLINYIKLFAFSFLVSFLVRSKAVLLKILATIVFVGVAGSLEGLYYFFAEKNVTQYFEIERFGGLRGDPNETAMVLVATIPIAYFFMENAKRNYIKISFVLILILISVGVMSTYSRGGFLAMLFVWSLIFLRNVRRLRSLAIPIIACIFFLTSLLPSLYYERVSTIFDSEHMAQDGSTIARKSAFMAGLKMFFDNPVFGVGLGYTKYETMRHANFDQPKGLHNMYLEMAAGGGFLSLFFFLCVIGISMMYLYKIYRSFGGEAAFYSEAAYFLGVGLGGMCFAGMFLSTQMHSVLWLMIGLSGGLTNTAYDSIIYSGSTCLERG